MKEKNKYKKECTKCARKFTSSYENSNPCISCGGEIVITHVYGVGLAHSTPTNCRCTTQPKPTPVERPKIERTVFEEWKGDSYTSTTINSVNVSTYERDTKALIERRDELNERIRKARYKLQWHQKRLEKGAFE